MNKRVIYEMVGLYRDDFQITGYEFGEGEKSVCIVGSSRGNEVQQDRNSDAVWSAICGKKKGTSL